jgi:hypothetical protein
MTGEEMQRRVDPGKLLAGVMMIGFGVLFLLDRFHFADFGDFISHFWPVLIIAIGISKLVRRNTMWAGLWLMTVGTWLQLVTLRISGMTYGNSWPLLLIALGAGIILRTAIESARSRREPNAH